MTKKINIMAISLITLFLAGCSSNGGSSGSSGGNISLDTNLSDSSNWSGGGSSSDSIKGKAFVLRGDDDIFSINAVNLSSNENIKQIVVDGKTIDVSPPADATASSDNGVVYGNAYSDGGENGDNSLYSGTKYSNSTFGYKIYRKGVDGNTENIAFIYAQGNITAINSVPTQGTATYSGDAIIGGLMVTESDGTQYSTIGVVPIELTADFSTKTLSGALTVTEGNSSALSATITENTFSGTSSDNITMNGQFNGDKADEVSGVLSKKGEEYFGAFGAVKK